MVEKAEKVGRPAGFERQAAVAAAMELLWKKGFLSVSARELAAAMSIQRSSFYNSFGSREALFREVLQLYGSQAPDRGLDQIENGDAVMPAFVTMLRTLCRERANDKEGRGCLVCNGIAELVGGEDEIGGLLEHVVKDRTQRVERLFRQAAIQGEIAPLDDPADAAKSFIAFLLGLNLLSKVVHDETQLWATCRQFLYGLGVDVSLLNNTGS